MKLHRFMHAIPSLPTEGEYITITRSDIYNQVRNVLRMSAGDECIICDGAGTDIRIRIVGYENRQVQGEIIEVKKSDTIATELHMHCAILKKQNFELVVQKATEIGIQSITPLLTERTIKTSLRLDRLKKITAEASEQSGRGTIPEIRDITAFPDALQRCAHTSILFDASGEPIWKHRGIKSPIDFFIGPEGGWTEQELDLAKEHCTTIASLGELTQRAETAAITATYSLTLLSRIH